jgi:hypothetical protein
MFMLRRRVMAAPKLVSASQADPEARFSRLAAQWKADTCILSSITEIAMHPAYQQIIGMGPAAIPLILKELERSPDQWFWALKAISGADPVPSESRGRVREMTSHWLKWAREQGYSW